MSAKTKGILQTALVCVITMAVVNRVSAAKKLVDGQ